MQQSKTCTKCGNELPATRDYFHFRKGTPVSQCKECIREYKKKYYQENKEKVCKKVNEYRNDNEELIRERKIAYYNKNKEKILDKNRKWREENKDRKAAIDRKYYLENREHILQYSRNYREENKEEIAKSKYEWYLRNKEHVIKMISDWCKENPEKANAMRQRRKARLRALPATLTNKQWKQIKKYFAHKCAYCGEDKPLEQDHFVALSKGGEYTHNNIIPACRNCNAIKSNKDFFEWYPTYEHYSEYRESKILEYLNYKDEGIQQLSIL